MGRTSFDLFMISLYIHQSLPTVPHHLRSEIIWTINVLLVWNVCLVPVTHAGLLIFPCIFKSELQKDVVMVVDSTWPMMSISWHTQDIWANHGEATLAPLLEVWVNFLMGFSTDWPANMSQGGFRGECSVCHLFVLYSPRNLHTIEDLSSWYWSFLG